MIRTSRRAGSGRQQLSISFERFATTSRADFRFAPLNALLLVAITVAGLVIHLRVHDFTMEAVAISVGSALGLSLLLRWTQVWEAVARNQVGEIVSTGRVRLMCLDAGEELAGKPVADE